MSAYFSVILDFVGAHPHYAIIAIFVLAWSEAIPVVGTVVPGSTLIIAVSALAAVAEINPFYLVAAAFAGAVAGDALSFWIGSHYHGHVLAIWPLNRYPQFIARSRAFITKYGITSVFLARFTAIVRAFVPLLAGVLRMRADKFYVANVLSALVWAPLHVFPGVLAAFALKLLGAGREHLVPIVLVCTVVLALGSGFLHGWYHKRPPRSWLFSLGRWPLTLSSRPPSER
jgi:membrane protein DedA with SNARE-associated domain